MGPTALLPLRRKACWGFFRPEKSDGLGRVWTRGTKGQDATSRPPTPLVVGCLSSRFQYASFKSRAENWPSWVRFSCFSSVSVADQGWRNFFDGAPPNCYKFRINPFVCPCERWRAKKDLVILHSHCYVITALLSLMHTKIRYKGADKSLARPGRKQTTATEDFNLMFFRPCIIV